jgi:hypothetical protein
MMLMTIICPPPGYPIDPLAPRTTSPLHEKKKTIDLANLFFCCS